MDPHIGLSEVWGPNVFSDIMKRGIETGMTHVGEKHMMFLNRYGYQEECHYSYRFVPVVGDDGYVAGHYTNSVDVTREALYDRRALSARHASTQIANSGSMSEFWPNLLSGFEPTKEDFPLVALYATSQHGSKPICPQSERITCLLEGAVGVSESHTPSRLVLPRERRAANFRTVNVETLLATLFQKSLDSPEPLLLTRDKLPNAFLKGITWRGFGRPSEEFLVIPLRTSNGIVIGFMFAGLNPYEDLLQSYQN